MQVDSLSSTFRQEGGYGNGCRKFSAKQCSVGLIISMEYFLRTDPSNYNANEILSAYQLKYPQYDTRMINIKIKKDLVRFKLQCQEKAAEADRYLRNWKEFTNAMQKNTAVERTDDVNETQGQPRHVQVTITQNIGSVSGDNTIIASGSDTHIGSKRLLQMTPTSTAGRKNKRIKQARKLLF
ncbi:uncharacterized protein BYT42DRAFT_154792 [Radiomyces spectabilis]|uniref:uncharacterized protein n=1 Tax=Radiomyces spectabilis TaxID=64574 RepID=UPI00221E6E51|nr:uncharacterized protein BYT42DRAFT_154792 [Radiomyces spectabilis]KAI8365171.1 hypothetical protein BYT42DRAFT_154792 [Radiomyces spectabilis]